jgi:hypothetical protein
MSALPAVLLSKGRAYCRSIGVELEGFSSRESSLDLPTVQGGHWEDDAGLNLCELITAPQTSVHEAFRVLRQLRSVGGDIEFVPERPVRLRHNDGKWQKKERYKVVVEALRRDVPEDLRLVHRMTNSAALQVNVSGGIDPFGSDGIFLINVFNNIAPYFAAAVHQETGLGKRHLSMWQKFARAERLPQAGRWFSDSQAMRQYIEAIPRLIRKTEDGSYTVDLVENMQMNSPMDLGTLWWFLRAKRGEHGSYLEFRFLPSLPLWEGERYAILLIDVVESFLDWFHIQNRSQGVTTADQARPAYRLISEQFVGYVPDAPLCEQEWQRLLDQ